MITFITVGKLKKDEYRTLTEDYLKRIGRFSAVKLIELADRDCDNDPAAVEKEGQSIIAAIPPGSFVISCDMHGERYTSEGFAEKLNSLFLGGKSHICFIVGGSAGLSESVRGASDMLLSFSSFTFPHNLFRVILCEQVYRAFMILGNRRYHK
ncbi:MAG: 23S rRNA (pseudouridine(1915)-N(3))-methyltransferase RlmH [Eubacteriaceae bacterium]|nr:23S rRNA (pseudouridine(1915)-N(3))-methyltransferase RlmH [Eubacteriaceae bacterium]